MAHPLQGTAQPNDSACETRVATDVILESRTESHARERLSFKLRTFLGTLSDSSNSVCFKKCHWMLRPKPQQHPTSKGWLKPPMAKSMHKRKSCFCCFARWLLAFGSLIGACLHSASCGLSIDHGSLTLGPGMVGNPKTPPGVPECDACCRRSILWLTPSSRFTSVRSQCAFTDGSAPCKSCKWLLISASTLSMHSEAPLNSDAALSSVNVSTCVAHVSSMARITLLMWVRTSSAVTAGRLPAGSGGRSLCRSGSHVGTCFRTSP